MAIYVYEALDKSGKQVSGTVDAETSESARETLQGQGLFPSSIEKQEPGTKSSILRGFGPGTADIALFTRQMGTLLEAGFTMLESLDTVHGQTANAGLAAVVSDLKDRVHRGESLSQAMSEHGDIFPVMYVSMVLAGEQSGRLPDIMSSIADYLDKKVKLRNKILVSLAYPGLMTIVGLGIIIFLVTFIAPTLAAVFAESDRQLPWLTRALMSTSDAVREWWPIGLVLLTTSVFFIHKWIQSTAGRRKIDELALKLPVIKGLALAVAMARFSRTLGVLLDSGVEILRAFEITSRVIDNRVLSQALDEVKESVAHGADLAGPLKASGLFPRLLVDMVAAGQKSGKLPAMLIRVADDMDEQVETKLNLAVALVEPALILAMGAAVALIVLAVMLPIVEMNRMY